MTTDAHRLTLEALDVETDLFKFFARTNIGIKFVESLFREAVPDPEPYAKPIVEDGLTSPVYAVTAEIQDVIASAAVSMPSYNFQPYDLPTKHGFVWFEKPMKIPDRKGDPVMFRGFTWISSQFVLVDDLGGEMPDADAGQGLFFLGFTDPTHPEDHLHAIETLPALQSPRNLLPIIAGCFSFDMPEWIESDGGTDGYGLVRWFMAFARFIQETWVDNRMVVQPRHAIKRAMRTTPRLDPPEVRVVMLRRKETTHHEHNTGETIERTHRWLVRGHWRNQWYPSLSVHRPKWIPEHIKGPDDKPLIVREKIFSVSR